MLGWEFPPFISGGLGTACYGLTRAMENFDVDITMLLPGATWGCEDQSHEYVELEDGAEENPAHVTFKPVPSELPNPYHRAHPLRIRGAGSTGGYDGNLAERVDEYARRCTKLIKKECFDVIHAHDWVTFPAGIALSAELSKPLVVHVHATEFDRSGQWINNEVYEIERRGIEAASLVIAVSQYCADILVERYGLSRRKIRVVHNGIRPKPFVERKPRAANGQRIILFLGRITGQKGPFCFVNAAEKVLGRLDNVKFVMAGWGDLAPAVIEQVASKRLGSKILFTGFLRGEQVDRAYRASDVFVMPSVSEPFGLTAVEAIQHGLPVILSKTTGVGEILNRGAVKIDFWDAEQIAETIVDILCDPALAQRLTREGREEIRLLTWDTAASKCLAVYDEALEMAGRPAAG